MQQASIKRIYFAFFVWTPLTIIALIATIISPVLIVTELTGYVSRDASNIGAVVLCLGLLVLQWSHYWIDKQDDLLDQLILGPAD